MTASELKATFNSELLIAAGLQVWRSLFETVRALHLVPNTQASYFPCESLYQLIPDVPAEKAGDEAGAGHAATRHFCQQVSTPSLAALPTCFMSASAIIGTSSWV